MRSTTREQSTRWIAVGGLLLAALSSVIALSQRNVAAEASASARQAAADANALAQQANEAVNISRATNQAEAALRELNEKIEEGALDPEQPWIIEAYEHWRQAATLARAGDAASIPAFEEFFALIRDSCPWPQEGCPVAGMPPMLYAPELEPGFLPAFPQDDS
jgi:hypothetical protein